GGDQRLGEPATLEQRVDAREVPAAALEGVAGVLGGHGLEVGARAERATGAGEDGDADLGIAVDLVPGVAHDRHHLAGERVARLRAVHGHDEDMVALLDQAVGHPNSPDVADSRASLAETLSETVTRSIFDTVSYNIADLVEH